MHSISQFKGAISRTSSSSILFAGMLVLACGIQFGCSTNPATGRLQFDTYSTQEEIALGNSAKPQLTKEYGGEIKDSVLRDYVTGVGTELAKHTEAYNPDLPWEFTVLDSPVINAFALPGGKVFISAGLLARMNNEAQLAGVLGHEIGHVTAQHTDERIGQALVVAGIAGAAGVAANNSDDDWAKVVPVIVGVGGQGYLLRYNRGQELEADQLGMRYMARARYNPAGQKQVMQILEDSRVEAGGGTPPEWLSTHPYPETRIREINNLLATNFKKTQNNPEYSLHEERFNRVARPRLDALELAWLESATERRISPHPTGLAGVAHAIAQQSTIAMVMNPAAMAPTWCSVCSESH